MSPSGIFEDEMPEKGGIEKRPDIITFHVLMRWVYTGIFVAIGWKWHAFAKWMLLTACIFIEIYWYLWRKAVHDVRG